jgi:hypothetical protein
VTVYALARTLAASVTRAVGEGPERDFCGQYGVAERFNDTENQASGVPVFQPYPFQGIGNIAEN